MLLVFLIVRAIASFDSRIFHLVQIDQDIADGSLPVIVRVVHLLRRQAVCRNHRARIADGIPEVV